jgi:dipeptidyl aminopeptidase/acylaminoacyl peptidase
MMRINRRDRVVSCARALSLVLVLGVALGSGCPCPRSDKTGPACPRAGSGRKGGEVILQGAPPIPRSLTLRLKQYLATRSANLNSLSDDGKAMLITSRFGQTSQVHLVKQPLGARTQLTFEKEPVGSATFVPGQRRAITFLSDVGGNERYQISRLNLDTGRATLLTDGKSRHRSYRWSYDGTHLAYNSNRRNGRDMDIWVSDGKTATSAKLLVKAKGSFTPSDWSPDGKRLLVSEYRSINESHLHVVDLATGRLTAVTPPKIRASYRQALFAHTAGKLYVTTDRFGDKIELYEVDLATQKWTPLTRDIPWNVERLALSPDGGTLALATNEEGYSVLRLLDTRTRHHRTAQNVPRGILSRLQFARKSGLLGFTLRGPTRTGDACTYDVRTARLTFWTASEAGGLNRAKLIRPTLMRYKTFDGRDIPCFYYRPAGAGPHPVVLYIHGGPESQARPYFRAFVQYLVREKSIAVLQPNVRGSDGYGKKYLLLDNGFKREDSVKDIGALLDWVKGRPELNVRRVGVLGGSYGGYMVLAALIRYAARIVAGVEIVGISNFVTFLKNTRAYRRNLRRAEYGDERDPKMRAFLEKISPNNDAAKIRSALFVAQGANDPRVPLSESEQIVRSVRQKGRDVWYMVAKNEGHGFRKRRNRDLFYSLMILFFEKHLTRGSR